MSAPAHGQNAVPPARNADTPPSPLLSQDGPAGQSAPVPAATSTRPAESHERLAVDRSSLAVQPPFIVQHDENADYTRDYARAQWRANDSIDLYVYRPRSIAKNPPVILYLYSYPTDSDKFLDANWAKRVTSRGYAAVGFVSALTGQRYHSRSMKQWFVSELQESLTVSAHDVQLVLDYLASRGDLDMDRVGMFGQGSGATIACLAASVDPRIKAIDMLDPWGDWPDWLRESPMVPEDERPSYLKPAFLDTLKDLDLPGCLAPSPRQKLRLEQVLSDPVTPLIAKDKIAAAVPAGRLIRYKDEGAHLIAWQASGTSGWIKSQLAEEEKPSTASGGGAKAR